jgi:DNA repair protein SbcC/Rad50
MLNLQSIESKIKGKLDDGHQVKEGILRFTRKYEGKPISYYFFDYSEDLDSAATDLKKYQDEVIAEHYFSNSGETQWNYYLVFLLGNEKYKNLKDSAPAATIERDKLFSRKFVLPEGRIEDFLNIPILEDHGLIEPTTDLVTRWTEKLDSVGLSAIGNKTPRAEVIRNFLSSNSTVGIEDEDSGISTELTSEGRRIRELHLKSYRPYPLQRDFKFGLMNLFIGANGTGKTSLLEAIELTYCGASLRGEGKPEPGAVINFKLEGQNEFEAYDPRTNKKYQQRDLVWYGRSISKGNDLFSSFNKYNFYNADSAYKLANDANDEEIDSAFSSLALGEKANHLDKRMRDFADDFSDKETTQAKQTKMIADSLDSENKKISQYSTMGNTAEKLFEVFQNTISTVNFTIEKPKAVESLEEDFSLQLYTLQKNIRSLTDNSSWLRPLTPFTIREALKAHQAVDEKIREKNQEINDAQKGLLFGDNNKKSLQLRIQLLKQLRRYFEDDRHNKIVGLSDRLQKTKFKRDFASKLQQLKSELTQEELASLAHDGSITNLLLDLKVLIDKGQSDLKTSELIFTKERETWGAVQKLQSDIKAISTKLLHENPHTTNCPVCDATYQVGQLKDLIDKSSLAGSSAALTQMKIELDNARDELKKRITEFQVIKKINDMWVFAKTQIEFSKDDALTIALEIETYLKSFPQFEADFNILKDQATSYSALGLSESELAQLKLQIGSAPYSLGELDSSLTQATQELASQEKIDSDWSAKILDAEKIKDTLAALVFSSNEIANRTYEDELYKRLDIFKELNTQLQVISKTLILSDSQDLNELHRKIDEICQQVGGISNANNDEKKSKIELDEAKKRVLDLQERLEQETVILNKLTSAKNLISEILVKDGKEQALSSFIEKNRSRIDSIFSRIHSPQEFQGLVPGTTKLLRLGQNEPISLNKVSTGQRAALAISVFFALNLSLKKAPPVILIDDPVAHVDDLNTLSFLDFLRELVVKSGRQVFFATASQKLAGLIEKKFKFLGDEEFKKFEFRR